MRAVLEHRAGVLDANAGAVACAMATLEPWRAYRSAITPGVSDGKAATTYRTWCVTESVAVADASSHYGRILIRPMLNDHIAHATTWVAEQPTVYTIEDASLYASLAGAGITHFRVVAMGVEAWCQASALNLNGRIQFNQLPMVLVNTTTFTAVGSSEPQYEGPMNKPGVRWRAFWMPPVDAPWVPIATQPSDDTQTLTIQFSCDSQEAVSFRTYMLVECAGVGSQLVSETTFLGDSTVYAQTLASSLLQYPQFCLERNAITDDVAGVVTALSKPLIDKALDWGSRKLENLAMKGLNTVGRWISGLFGATLSPDELRIYGTVVSLGRDRAQMLVPLVQAHSTDLYDYCEQQLGGLGTINIPGGKLGGETDQDAEVKHPGPVHTKSWFRV